MNMRNTLFRITLLTMIMLLGLSTLCEKKAFAKRGIGIPILINVGDAIYPIGPIPDRLAQHLVSPDADDWELGYMCQHVGVFYADIVCWDKKLVLCRGNTYCEIPEQIREGFEAEYPFSKTKRSTWNRFGIFVFVLIVAVAMLVKIVFSATSVGTSEKDVVDDFDEVQSGDGYREYDDSADEQDETICPKCGSARRPGETECPACGIIYQKFKKRR